MDEAHTPPILAAFQAYPSLRSQVEPTLTRQANRIAIQAANFVGRDATVNAFRDLVRNGVRGIVALEAPPGAGASALICALAATWPYCWWLREDDERAGLEALCAQIIALHDLMPPLLSPIAGRDAKVLEQLLEQASERRAPNDPLVLLIDGWHQPEDAPFPPLFPASLPPNVVLLCTCVPGQRPPLPPVTRLVLPLQGPDLEREMTAGLRYAGCAPHAARRLVAHSHGSFLYLRIGQGLFEQGTLDVERLPDGLDALLEVWWQQASLQRSARELGALLAASREPLPVDLIATMLEIESGQVLGLLDAWTPLIERAEDGAVRLAHPAVRAFLLHRAGPLAQRTHEALVKRAIRQSGPKLKPADAIHPALLRQLAANIAASPSQRSQLAPLLLGRDWVAARERLFSLQRAADDAAWALRAAVAVGSPALLARAAVITGTLSALSRTLAPEAVVEAFSALIARDNSGNGRTQALKSVQALVDRLPEGRGRARVLRRLGEACYANEMRGAAMRLLSQALDMEDQTAPRSWQDEREQTLAGLSRAALSVGDVAGALEICVRIRHSERRGLSETEVVRWLTASGNLPRAEKTANAISNEGMREWALAEVAVEYARSGDMIAATSLLADNTSPTAVAWAETELACDLAKSDTVQAMSRVARMSLPAHRDRAYSRVAVVLATRNLPVDALAATTRIENLVLRAESLIELSAVLAGSADEIIIAALGEVQEAAAHLNEHDRAPVLAGIAAAQAACRQPDAANASLQLLEEGEERDRALGRVAVALARHDQIVHADTTIRAMTDDDERDWALSELARLLAHAGGWDAAHLRVAAVIDDEQRDTILTELVTLQARAGMPDAALAHSSRIGSAASRARALTAVAVVYGAAHDYDRALAVLERLPNADARSRCCAALAAALAGAGDTQAALTIARRAARPFDQARGLADVARSVVEHTPHLAIATLGEALLMASQLGRSEALRAIELVAPSLAALGGISALEEAATTLDEVDDWWRL